MREANLREGDLHQSADELQAFYNGALRQALEDGDGFYNARLFGRAARSYLKAASNLPQGLDYDLELWREAVETTHSDPKTASEKFRRLFRDHRAQATMFR